MGQIDNAKKEELQELLEGLNLSIMLLEPEDPSQCQQLADDLKHVETCLGGTSSPNASKLVQELQAFALGNIAECNDILEALQDGLENLTRIIESGEDKSSDTAPSDKEPGAPFALPSWVDEDLYGEFLAGQRLSLEELEVLLLSIEEGEGDAVEDCDELKRRLHSLKGDAATVGMEALSHVYHDMETLIEATSVPCELVDPCLKALDWVGDALKSYAHLCHPDQGVEHALAILKPPTVTIESKPVLKDEPTSAQETPQVVPAPTPTPPTESIPIEWDDETIELIAEFLMEADEGIDSADRILLESQNGQLVGEQVNALFRIFHTIKGVAGFLNLDAIGLLAHATESVLNRARDGVLDLVGLPLNLVFEATDAMRELLSGVRDAAENLAPLPSQVGDSILNSRLINVTASGKEGVPEIPKAQSVSPTVQAPPPAVKQNQPSKCTSTQTAPPKPKAVAPKKATPTKATSQRKKKGKGERERTVQLREVVKVDLERVDGLVDLIGELVILESMVTNSLRLETLKGRSVLSLMNQLNKAVRDLQSLGLALRMVPLRGAFQKMARLVRDVSLKSKKSARLVVSGEKTEMDRRLVESISDPLVHMVRNSVDHGLETPEERRRVGKNETGTVRLSASHDGGNIVIEIADDGKGLNREAILSKAIQKGVISETSNLKDEEIWQLIFAPGFSTAAQVTEISGRGVGMDVVKRNIEALRGRITIQSVQGEGTTFKLHLPLTLAIISGLLFSLGDERYILPTLSVVESFQPSQDLVSTYGDGTEIVNVRGEILPLYRLDKILGTQDSFSNIEDGLLVIVQGTRQRGALLVDNILGQHNIVIKTLRNGSQSSKTFSGAAILSDGRVGLILNVDELLTRDTG